MASHDTYQDPYAAHGAHGAQGQYGDYEAHDKTMPNYAHQGSDYNSYGPGDQAPAHLHHPHGLNAEKPHPDDLDGVNQLGEIGGTERVNPGRAGLHNPTSSFAAMGPPPRSTGVLRMWRKDERGKQWFRGGGFRSGLRLVCCCLTIAIIMVISIILTVLMYIRPPSVILNEVKLDQNTLAFDPSNQQFGLRVNLSITVQNPNWFDANFKKIIADVKYEGGKFGGGQLNQVNFVAYKQSTFDFPFYLNYSMEADPGNQMITSLANACGVNGPSQQKININYNLKLSLSLFSATISPTVNNDATIDCPLTADQIKQIINHG